MRLPCTEDAVGSRAQRLMRAESGFLKKIEFDVQSVCPPSPLIIGTMLSGTATSAPPPAQSK